MPVEKKFFFFLGVGLEIIEPKGDDISMINTINEKEWLYIKELSIRQGVSAIIIDGINRLLEIYGSDAINSTIPKGWWQSFIIEWSSIVFITESKNRQQEIIMNELGTLWTEQGCKVLVMKGLANGLNYPKPNHRSPGDIDCFLFDDYERGNQIAREAGADVDESWYKHSEISYKGEIFENHRFFLPVRDGKESKELDRELRKSLDSGMLKNYPGSVCFVPPTQFCAMFLTAHACGHFLYEGLRLKQVLDWAMFIHHEQNNINWSSFYDFCNRYHFRKFVDAMNEICCNLLGIEISNKLVVTKSVYSKRIVDSILYDNDYVYSEGGNKWKVRFHLIRNIFHYKWKFEEIYDQNVWLRLFKDVRGFLFHNEG